MGRLSYPSPDRRYLQVIESIEYHMDEIRRCLRLGTLDPNSDPKGFMSAVRHAEFLVRLLRTAAVAQERHHD